MEMCGGVALKGVAPRGRWVCGEEKGAGSFSFGLAVPEKNETNRSMLPPLFELLGFCSVGVVGWFLLSKNWGPEEGEIIPQGTGGISLYGEYEAQHSLIFLPEKSLFRWLVRAAFQVGCCASAMPLPCRLLAVTRGGATGCRGRTSFAKVGC